MRTGSGTGMVGMWTSLFLMTLSSSIGGVWFAARRKTSPSALNGLISFGTGVLLGTTVLEFLPGMVAGNGTSLLPLVLTGFSLMFVLDFLFREQRHHTSLPVFSLMAGMLLHAFVEGFSIMTGYRLHPTVGNALFWSLLAHKLTDSILIASLLLAVTGKRRLAYLGCMILAGALLTGAWTADLLAFGMPDRLFGMGTALAAGVLWYVAASHLVPHILQHRQGPGAWLFLAGICVSLLVHAFPHGYHHE